MPIEPGANATPSRRARWRRGLRIGVRVIGITLAVVLVALGIAVALPGTRGAALERALRAVDDALPGSFTARSSWPRLGRIELRGVRWENEGARLLQVSHLDLDLRLRPLADREAVVREVVVEGVWADVDGIAAALADSTGAVADTVGAESAAPSDVPWLREGAIEGLPAFAIEALDLRDLDLRTAGTGVLVHSVSSRLDARPGRTEVARLDLDVESTEYGRLRGGVSVAAGDSLRARFDVWNWTPPGEVVRARAAGDGLQVALPADLVPRLLAGDVDVIPLQAHGRVVESLPADLALAATWGSDGALQVVTRVRLPVAPTWVRPYLADADSTTTALVEGLLADWPEPARAYGADVNVRANVRGAAFTSLRAAVRTDLPGPADVVAELDPAHGRGATLELDVWPEGDRALRGSFTLDAPGWARVVARHAAWDGATTYAVDSLRVNAPGLDVVGGGTFDGESVAADLVVDARVADLARRLTEELGDGPWNDLPVVLRLEADVDGALPRPRADLRMAAGTQDDPTALDLRATHDAEDVDLDLTVDVVALRPLVPDSLKAALDATTVERARLRLRGAYDLADTSATADLDLAVVGRDARVGFGGRFDASIAGAFAARIDSLRAAWGDLDLGATGPISIAADLADSTLQVDGLALSGSVGRVDADVDATPARATGRVVLDLDLDGVSALLPDSLSTPLAASTLKRLSLDLEGAFDPRAQRGDARLRLDALADEGSARVDADFDAQLPHRVSVRAVTLRARWRDLELDADRPVVFAADLDASTFELQDLALRSTFGTLRGSARADSSSADGRLDLDLAITRARLIEWLPDLDDSVPAGDSLRVRADLALGGTALAPRADVEGAVVLTATDEGDLAMTLRANYDETRWLVAEARVREGDVDWMQAEVRAPIDVSVETSGARLRADDPLRIAVETPTLDLERIATRTKAPFDLTGDLRIAFEATGPLASLGLSGNVESSRARVDLPDGSWLETTTSIQLSGDARAPRVDGEITVPRGLVLLPEVAPSRLPTQGEALLWDTRAVEDTVRATPRAVTPLDTFTLPLPDVVMKLSVPRGVRIRGHGLDIEVVGDVEAVVENGVPGLGGGLDVARGRLELLGRRFAVETGTVIFDPDQVEPDPTLDIRLATTLQGTRYTVDVTGTATQPRIALGSDPSMPEGDIVSALLFGRPLDELDEGQSSLLAQRTSEIAAAYGARLLSQRIGQRLGVDILSIEPGTDGGAASLVVGQYLSPDVIVQYEQVLEEGAAALVRLEYAITRALRLETTASQGEHSGIELEWRKDY